MRVRSLLPLAVATVVAAPMISFAATQSGGQQAAAFPPEAGKQGKPAVGTGVDLKPTANWSYQGGTDLEFATVKGRDYAVAPAQNAQGGIRIFDLTANPANPPLVGYLPCKVSQNDVQVRGNIVFVGVDGGVKATDCFPAGVKPALGVVAVDISNPRKPKGVGFIPIKFGAHNSTLHPSGKYLYISDSELVPAAGEPTGGAAGRIKVVDISNVKKMKEVFYLPLPTGLSSHDIDFNKKGNRAYSAALTQTLIIDTSEPATPKIITTIIDPAVNISHGADLTPDETHLYVTDEQAGAAANGVCNVGGVHVYDIRVEAAPVKTALYVFSPVNSLTATTNSFNTTCTAHVLQFGPTGKTFSNAGYAAGVRIVDIASSRVGLPAELASFTAVDADTWSAKQYKNPRYLYANDLARGFDTYEYKEGLGPVDTRTPTQKKLGVTRVGSTFFMDGAWCANPSGDKRKTTLALSHH